MQGYHWAETADGELLVVMFAHGKGYVPGVDNAIDLSIITVLEPVPWPIRQSQNLVPLSSGRPAPAVTPECVILPFVANG